MNYQNQNQPNNNHNNQSKIKPCPHCGSDDLRIIINLKSGTGYIECQNCGATGPKTGTGKELAVWNSRKGEGEKVNVIYIVPKGFVA
jgi:Lar family restriction alleviation protein